MDESGVTSYGTGARSCGMIGSTALDKGTGHEAGQSQDRFPLTRAFDSRVSRRHRLASPLEPWIPLPEGRFPFPIQHARPDLQEEMHTARGPGRLLHLAKRLPVT
jgi:hypothetical protein